MHAGLGKVSFEAEALRANMAAFTAAILAARPKGLKGTGLGGYILTATLSSTMGPGVPVDLSSLLANSTRRHGAAAAAAR